jgi:hypothetical protein
MHLDDDTIERLLHGEPTALDQAAARAHLRSCPDCRGRWETAGAERREVFRLLRHLDHTPSGVSAETVASRSRRARYGWARWAAGVALVVGLAGAVYGLPNSWLRSWTETVVARLRGAAQQLPPLGAPIQQSERQSGVATAPGSKFVISFTSSQPGSHARITLAETTDVAVRSRGGAARFTLQGDGLVVDNAESASSFEITVPRSAPLVTIIVAERRVFLKRGAVIETNGPISADSSYLIPLSIAAP